MSGWVRGVVRSEAGVLVTAWLCDGMALEWTVIGSVSACSNGLVILFLFPSNRPALFPSNVPAVFSPLVQLSYHATSPCSVSVYSCVRLLRMVFPDRILCIINNLGIMYCYYSQFLLSLRGRLRLIQNILLLIVAEAKKEGRQLVYEQRGVHFIFTLN